MIEWRRQYGPEEITFDSIKIQSVAKNLEWRGVDQLNRPILWARPDLWNQKDSEGQLRYHVKVSTNISFSINNLFCTNPTNIGTFPTSE
jgi:hypothetical protein